MLCDTLLLPQPIVHKLDCGTVEKYKFFPSSLQVGTLAFCDHTDTDSAHLQFYH